MKVVAKEPGKGFEIREVENTLEGIREAIGCDYIECVTLCTDCVIICDEEGRINDAQFNCEMFGTQDGAVYCTPIRSGEEVISADDDYVVRCKGYQPGQLTMFEEDSK